MVGNVFWIQLKYVCLCFQFIYKIVVENVNSNSIHLRKNLTETRDFYFTFYHCNLDRDCTCNLKKKTITEY